MARKNDGVSAKANTSTAAPPDLNSTRARGSPPTFPTRPAAVYLLVTPDNSRSATLISFSALSHHEEIKDTKAWGRRRTSPSPPC